ncbi:hypothetical protein HGRIS_005431 [Hohenbuehelia grisea]|uniref:Uncharacterized protein n=1 Tax=Hohenbuehelia grisea TaxID=104357 RepID=A0ABR3JY95_9AGAR
MDLMHNVKGSSLPPFFLAHNSMSFLLLEVSQPSPAHGASLNVVHALAQYVASTTNPGVERIRSRTALLNLNDLGGMSELEMGGIAGECMCVGRWRGGERGAESQPVDRRLVHD